MARALVKILLDPIARDDQRGGMGGGEVYESRIMICAD
jgi:hypothetical protein